MSDTAVSHPRVRIEVHLAEPDDRAVRAELRAALTGTPRSIPSKYFYDDFGSALFEQICELPEYYPTRTETALLERIAPELLTQTGARELVELGSGAARKTRHLLDAMTALAGQTRYVPVDVSAGIVRRTTEELAVEYPRLEIHGLVADFMTDLGELPEGGRRLVAFLGGTIGNLYDRIVFGGVRDFLYFYKIEWPVFNVADCCLVVGAGLLLFQAMFAAPPSEPATQSEPVGTNASG